MRRLLTWLVVSLGIAALIRRLRRSRQEPEVEAPAGPAAAPAAPVEAPAEDDPADELRRKLADSRDDEPAAADAASVEERRADVHDEGRAALEEMRGTDES
jgi:hypothetical protein